MPVISRRTAWLAAMVLAVTLGCMNHDRAMAGEGECWYLELSRQRFDMGGDFDDSILLEHSSGTYNARPC